MKQIPLLIAVVVLSGCAKKMYNDTGNTTAERKQNFELDNADCRKSASLQSTVSLARRGSEKSMTTLSTSNNQQKLDNESGENVKKAASEWYNQCMLRLGWSHHDVVTHNDDYKKEIENQARVFFEQHPEYVNSKEEEEQLSIEFQNTLNAPQNKGLDLYQILLVAHEQVQASKSPGH